MSVNLIGVASEAVGELISAKKKNVSPIIGTVEDIKKTIEETKFVKTVTKALDSTLKAGPDIIDKTTAAASDLIKVKLPLSTSKL